MHHLDRFLEAQADDYRRALCEVKAGRKTTHWMWYIFPQPQGLGHSERARYYAIADLDEARAYLNHPILGVRLREISGELLRLPGTDPVAIFGQLDALKLYSCMTLFASVDESPDGVFRRVLGKYFEDKVKE